MPRELVLNLLEGEGWHTEVYYASVQPTLVSLTNFDVRPRQILFLRARE
jgi:hypothetical protein